MAVRCFQLTNSPGGWSATIPVESVPDGIIESNEEFRLSTIDAVHNNPIGVNIDKTDQGVVEIIDDDIVEITVAPAAVTEQDVAVPALAKNKATISVTVKPGTPAGTLNLYTSDGTAVAGATGIGKDDYVAVSHIATWDGTKFTPNAPTGTATGTTFAYTVGINSDSPSLADTARFERILPRRPSWAWNRKTSSFLPDVVNFNTWT